MKLVEVDPRDTYNQPRRYGRVPEYVPAERREALYRRWPLVTRLHRGVMAEFPCVW